MKPTSLTGKEANLLIVSHLVVYEVFFHLPPFELPIYRCYNSTGNPFVHIKEFMYESSLWKNDNRVLAFLFRKSLDGPALEWFYSLEPVDAEDFEAVQRKFLQRYRDRVGPSLSITDLMVEKMKVDEDFPRYPPLLDTLPDIFNALMAANALTLPREQLQWPPNVDTSLYCAFHWGPGHTLEACFHFKDYIYDLNDNGRIDWEEMRKYITEMKARRPPRQNS
ncbi:hypothetical protein Taro_032986 [Colocasia esculenta]|uniref:EF-hand domain-containing protein n=1 Tax=Colocasia esculenta TaxID=4460 RepID=A0A843W7Q5_COLES|nr:hypothetical protein [Colocasia esculenta]